MILRFIHVYLIGYSVVVLGAVAALWHGGVLRQIAPTWIVIALAIAAGFGIMLALSTGRRETSRES